MKDGYIRAAAMTPKIKVADCRYNTEQIKELITKAYDNKAAIVSFPELCITGYTCNDLFLQDTLIDEAYNSLIDLKKYTGQYEGMAVVVGLPYMYMGKLYNVAAVLMNGHIIGLVPKMNIPNYAEFYERRQFKEGFKGNESVNIDGEDVDFGGSLICQFGSSNKVKLAIEICEDLWTPAPPSIRHALNGATIIVNLSASNETIGKSAYRRELVKGQSARLVCGYIYSTAGDGESTQDIVFGAHNLICENGTVLVEAKKFTNEAVYADIDVDRICSERRRMSTFTVDTDCSGYTVTEFETVVEDLDLIRYFDN